MANSQITINGSQSKFPIAKRINLDAGNTQQFKSAETFAIRSQGFQVRRRGQLVSSISSFRVLSPVVYCRDSFAVPFNAGQSGGRPLPDSWDRHRPGHRLAGGRTGCRDAEVRGRSDGQYAGVLGP